MGAVAKAFGVLFLVAGIALLLGGIAAAAFGYLDQQDNEDQGPLGLMEDPERSEDNESMVAVGAVGAAVGVVLTVLGAVLVSAGGGKAAAATSEPPGATAEPTDADETTAPSPSRRPVNSTRRVALAVAGVAAGLLVVLVLWGVAGGDGSGPAFLSDDGDGPDGDGRLLAEESHAATLPMGLTVLGQGFGLAGDAPGADFGTPADTGRVELTVSWDAQAGGVSTLRLVVERQTDDGWEGLADVLLGSGESLNVTGPELGGALLRWSAAAGEDGATAGQGFEVRVRSYD